MSTRLGLPNLGLGVGLRNKHLPFLLKNNSGVDWFEIISENFIDNHGYSRFALEKIAMDHPIVMHGVSLSIGSSDPLNFNYLDKLKDLAKFVKPQWISDHLCWTGINNFNTHDLLPLPLTEESLEHVAKRVLIVQDYLERPLILENPSTYLEFKSSKLKEWDFLTELVNLTNCGLLLDVNNVYVSSRNHGFSAEHYVKNIPHKNVVQIHIAGPSNCGKYLIDTHDHPVPLKVWKLYKLAMELTGGVSTLLEWDAKIPDFPLLKEELFKAKKVLEGTFPNEKIAEINKHSVSNPVDYQLSNIYE